jgi:hypothetical protein
MIEKNNKNTGDEKVTVTLTTSILYGTIKELDWTKNEYNEMTDSEKETLHKEIKDEWLEECCYDALEKRDENTSYKMVIDHTDEEIYQY